MKQATQQDISVNQKVLWIPATNRKHSEEVTIKEISGDSIYIQQKNSYHRWTCLADLYLIENAPDVVKDETALTIQDLTARRLAKQVRIDERNAQIDQYKVLIANLEEANDANYVEAGDILAQIHLLKKKGKK